MTAPAAWPMRKHEATQLNDDDDIGEQPAPAQALPDQGPAGALITEMANLLLGAARLGRYRTQFADTWTYFTGGCFLVWTVIIVLGR